jgi:hypothetical protein
MGVGNSQLLVEISGQADSHGILLQKATPIIKAMFLFNVEEIVEVEYLNHREGDSPHRSIEKVMTTVFSNKVFPKLDFDKVDFNKAKQTVLGIQRNKYLQTAHLYLTLGSRYSYEMEHPVKSIGALQQFGLAMDALAKFWGYTDDKWNEIVDTISRKTNLNLSQAERNLIARARHHGAHLEPSVPVNNIESAIDLVRTFVTMALEISCSSP